MTLFGDRVIADVIRKVRRRSHWSRVALNPILTRTGIFIKRGEETQRETHRGRCHLQKNVDTEVMHP